MERCCLVEVEVEFKHSKETSRYFQQIAADKSVYTHPPQYTYSEPVYICVLHIIVAGSHFEPIAIQAIRHD